MKGCLQHSLNSHSQFAQLGMKVLLLSLMFFYPISTQRLTAYLDLNLNKCYVISLNTSIVMPPKDFLELLVNIKVTVATQGARLLSQVKVNYLRRRQVWCKEHCSN